MDSLTVVHECSRLLLARRGEVQEALQDVLALLAHQAGLQRGTIALLEPDSGALVITAAHGLSPEQAARGRYRMGEGITGKVAQERRSAVVPNIAGEPLFLDRTGARREVGRLGVSFICVPVVDEGELVGTLSVDRALDDSVSLEENVRLLEVIAGMMAAAVRRLRLDREERAALEQENQRLRAELGERSDIANLLGRCRNMQAVKGLVRQVAPTLATVLIRGESGTGKELVARAIHALSPRRDGPFVAVNCAALPEALIESELFGHERGAFTGATERRKGRFELAGGGTLLLDEIGDVSPAVQVRLLRVLQEREFERVGGNATISVDVRVVSATSRPLERLVEEGRFREDLFYRLNVFPVFLPPLRERRSDIVLLVDHFLEKYGRLHGRQVSTVTERALSLLMAHRWPGNVRELENVVERAVLLSSDGVVHSFHLPPSLQAYEGPAARPDEPRAKGGLEEQVAAFEREIISEALAECHGNSAAAARLLRTTPRILRYRLRSLGVDWRDWRRGAPASPPPPGAAAGTGTVTRARESGS